MLFYPKIQHTDQFENIKFQLIIFYIIFCKI